MQAKTNININGRDYTEKYIAGIYTLYKGKNILAMVTTSNRAGLYIAGSVKDVSLWFESLGVGEV